MGKVKLKMGMHNRITKERFISIKEDINAGKTVTQVMKKHGISDGTVHKVRRSKDYHEYRIRADQQLRDRHPIVVIAEKSGLPYEDFGKKPIFSSKPLKTNDAKRTDRLDEAAEDTSRFFGFILLGIVVIMVVVVIALTFSRSN